MYLKKNLFYFFFVFRSLGKIRKLITYFHKKTFSVGDKYYKDWYLHELISKKP